jgi:hypothetical protein
LGLGLAAAGVLQGLRLVVGCGGGGAVGGERGG